MFGQLGDTDLKALRTFFTIVNSGGFTPAQVELGVSAATISTQMTQLEVRLGLRLCYRGHAGFRLTREGEEVFKSCEKLFSSIENFKNEIAETSDILVGELRVGLINNTITHPDLIINDAIEKFSKMAPEVRIVLYVGLETEIESRVLDGRLHVGVTVAREKFKQLEYRELAEEKFELYCGKGHPLFTVSESDISFDNIEKYPYVARDYWERQKVFSAPFKAKVSAETPEIEGMARLILTGHYMGYLPTHYAEQWVATGLMRSLLSKQTAVSGDIVGIRMKSPDKARVLELFWDCMFPC